MESLNNLENLKYAELQHLAKWYGIKANMKAEKLRAALAEFKEKNFPAEPRDETLESAADITETTTVQAALPNKPPLSPTFHIDSDDSSSEETAASQDATESMQLEPQDIPAEMEIQPSDSAVEKTEQILGETCCVANESFVAGEQLPVDADPEITINITRSAAKRMTYDAKEARARIAIPVKRPSDATKASATKKFKDWAAIHEREFKKMDSLDVFLEKRQQRRCGLKTPLKRATAFTAKLSKLAVHTESTAQPKPTAIPRLVVFAPTVLTTSNMTTNFSSMYKTPSAAAKTPFRVGLSVNKSVRKSIGKPTKENGTDSPLVDHNKSANKSMLSTSIMTTKKQTAFDLKASLARPITWTPHVGKLKPFSAGRADPKNVKTKTREDRRQEAKAVRQEQRRAVQMQRRN